MRDVSSCSASDWPNHTRGRSGDAVIGLRLLDEMTVRDITLDRPWEKACWLDRDGVGGLKIDLGRLAADADFLRVVR